jgi:hypothetical protein
VVGAEVVGASVGLGVAAESPAHQVLVLHAPQ